MNVLFCFSVAAGKQPEAYVQYYSEDITDLFLFVGIDDVSVKGLHHQKSFTQSS